MCISANIRLEAKHPRVRKEGSLKLLKHQEGGEQSHIGHSLSQHLFDLKFCFMEILIVLCVCVSVCLYLPICCVPAGQKAAKYQI